MSTGERKLRVFLAFRPFFHVLKIFNPSNFQNQNYRLVIQNVFIAIAMVVLFVVGELTVGFGCLWYCFSYKFNLSETALPIGLLFTGTQMSVTYITMGLQHTELENALTGLEKKINKRKVTIYK